MCDIMIWPDLPDAKILVDWEWIDMPDYFRSDYLWYLPCEGTEIKWAT